MNHDKALDQIPIVAVDAPAGRRLHRQRRLVQLATIVLAIVVPVSGLFRIDPVEGAFVVFDRQIWFADFFIVVGLWLAISCLLVMTYSLVGTAFCGWSCPQNTLAEWANRMTHKWLGKRAEVTLDGAPMRLSQGKDRALNWALLGSMFLGAAMSFALIPLFYFYEPEVIWSFVTLRDDARLAPSLHYIYAIFVLILFLDIAFIRHFWCRFMCVYRVWQHTFKTRETLHVAHDPSQPDECARCNYCESSCFIGIDPRKTDTYDACINCGECITACSSIRASRKTGKSLLRFEVGERRDGDPVARPTNVGSIMLRAPWAALLAFAGLLMFAWGLWSYESVHLSVYRAETLQGDQISDYRISIANKTYRPLQVTVAITGLPEDGYQLPQDRLHFDTAGRQDLNLHLPRRLAQGLHPFRVEIRASDGTQQAFKIHHFVGG